MAKKKAAVKKPVRKASLEKRFAEHQRYTRRQGQLIGEVQALAFKHDLDIPDVQRQLECQKVAISARVPGLLLLRCWIAGDSQSESGTTDNTGA